MQNQHPVSRFLLLIAILTLMVGVVGSDHLVKAQGNNLLQNPGFEGTYTAFAGNPTQLVAPGWSAWFNTRKPGEPGFVNLPPDYRPAQNTARIHGGQSAQEFFTFFATHTGGVFQRVALAAGNKVHFSVFLNVWSTSLDDINKSDQPGGVKLRVGVDPNGGTNAGDPGIVWSDQQEFYDEYRQLSVDAVSASTFVTVFVESAVKDPVKNNNVYVDDASLVVVGQGTVPSATPGAIIVTNTPTPGFVEPTREGGEPTASGPTNTPLPPLPTIPGGVPTQEGATSVAPTPVSPNLPGQVIYTVVTGDTVSAIAARFNSTVDAIIQANGLSNAGLIFVGQKLIIPVPTTPTPVPPPTSVAGGPTAPAPVSNANLTGPTVNGIGTYIVQPGDTLAAIAARYGVTVETLARLNGIVNPNSIVIGQVLAVPGPGNNYPGGTVAPTVIPTSPAPPARKTYVVQAGDNLFRISLRFGVTLDALMRANGITNPNLVYVGQVLTIP